MLRLIDVVSSSSSAAMEPPKPNRIRVSEFDMKELLHIVQQLVRDKSSQALNARVYVMSAINVLMRHPAVFETIRSDIPQNILSWCKDGRHNLCNKLAWKMFYQMIEYHAGVLEELIDKKLLALFTDLLALNKGRGSVAINSIHYVGKLFTMLASENKRLQYHRPTKRDDIKSVERDVKTFCQFFQTHMCFIKLHIVLSNRTSTQLGAAFLEIAKIYYSFATLPELEKLYTNICKDANYKASVMSVKAMYT